MEASDKFLARENLGRGYTEQITKFLKTNSLDYYTTDPSERNYVMPG